ncbi:transcription initiation factor IIB [Candidatus Bathyarchaeota archaeon]|nr:transcription initiation factor IIB [Candidatus Bathyarchaeota archaeon]
MKARTQEVPDISKDRCPECGSDSLIEDYELGEVVCSNCGLVVKVNALDNGPEWRAFSAEERDSRSRVGVPLSFSIHDKGLSTVIEQVNKDALGRELPLHTRIEMLRLRKWQIRSRIHSSMERNLSQAMAEIDRLSDKVHVPASIKEEAALVYRKALERGLVRGRSITAIAAASLYAACRLTETPRTLKEIAGVCLAKEKDVARCYRLLVKELELKMPIADPVRCVPKIASRLQISEKIQQMAVEILHECQKRKIASGKDPMGLASAAIYIALCLESEKRTQKEIAKVAGVTEVTIRNRYNGLREALGLEV